MWGTVMKSKKKKALLEKQAISKVKSQSENVKKSEIGCFGNIVL